MNEKEIRELAIDRYGNDPHSFAKQRDGFVEGFKLGQEFLTKDIVDIYKKNKDLWSPHDGRKCPCCDETGYVDGEYIEDKESCLTCNGRGTI